MQYDHEQWLLLHGTPLTPEVWDALVPLLPQQGAPMRPDITPAPDADDVQASLVQRVIAQLATDVGALNVVGHSFGGQIAIDLALAIPDRIRSLTIMCSQDIPFPAFGPAAVALEEGKPPNIDAAMERWLRPEELAANGTVVQYTRRCLRQADPTAWARALSSITSFDRSAVVARIQVPVTLIAAELDRISLPSVMGALADRLPDAQLHVLKGAVHMSPFLDPPSLATLFINASARAG